MVLIIVRALCNNAFHKKKNKCQKMPKKFDEQIVSKMYKKF